MGNQTDCEQLDRVRDYVQTVFERLASYHNHKESVSYTGFALFVGAAGVILTAEKWPPTAWGEYRTIIAILALTGFWVLVFRYLRFQLHRRRWAALRVAGCERVLTKFATGNIVNNNSLSPAHRPEFTRLSRWRIISDYIWPNKFSVRAIEMSKTDEEPLYPGILIDAWVAQEVRGTDALKRERLIVVTGWALFFAMLVRTNWACG